MSIELSNLESLEEAVLPIKEEIGRMLDKMYLGNQDRTEDDMKLWRFFMGIIKDRSNINFAFLRLPGYENLPTLKIGISDDEKTKQEGFILPLTLKEVLEIHGALSDADFQTLVEYAAISTITKFKHESDNLIQENNPDAPMLLESFGMHIAEIENYLAHLRENPRKNWKIAVQLYWEQAPVSLLRSKKD